MSFESFCNANIKMNARYGEARGHMSDNMPNNWRVVLKYNGRQFTTDFFGGSAVTSITTTQVVRSLILDACAGEESYQDFCSSFGYEEDASSLKTWKACQRIRKNVIRLFGEEMFQSLVDLSSEY